MRGMEEHVVVLVGCGKSKVPGLVPAKDKYDSTYFDKKRKYAETVGDEWFILSAKWGLLDPDRPIDDYDVSMGDVDPNQWATLVEEDIERLSEFDQVYVLAGRNYIDPISPILSDTFRSVFYPFDSPDINGIGDQMSFLTDYNATE